MSERLVGRVLASGQYKRCTLMVLMALAEWATDDGLTAPTNKQLIARLGFCERQIRNSIRQMIADHALTIVDRASGKPGCGTQYRIILPDTETGAIQPIETGAVIGPTGALVAPLTGAVSQNSAISTGAMSIPLPSSSPPLSLPPQTPLLLSPLPSPPLSPPLDLFPLTLPPSVIEQTAVKEPKRKPRCKIPESFPLSSELERLRALKYWGSVDRKDIDFKTEAMKFRAHHVAHGSVMASWPAAWQTWFMNAPKFNARRQIEVRASL